MGNDRTASGAPPRPHPWEKGLVRLVHAVFLGGKCKVWTKPAACSAQCLAAWRFFFNFNQVVQNLAFLHMLGRVSCVSWPGQFNQNCFSPSKLNTARLAERGTMRESWRPETGPLLTDSPAAKFCIYILLPTLDSIFFPPIVFSNHLHPSPSEPGTPKLWISPQKDSCQDPYSQGPENKAVRAFMFFFCSAFCNLFIF